MEMEIVKGFMGLGGLGLMGLIFYFSSRASDNRLDKILADTARERDLWRLTIEALSKNLDENTLHVKNVDCLASRRKLTD